MFFNSQMVGGECIKSQMRSLEHIGRQMEGMEYIERWNVSKVR